MNTLKPFATILILLACARTAIALDKPDAGSLWDSTITESPELARNPKAKALYIKEANRTIQAFLDKRPIVIDGHGFVNHFAITGEIDPRYGVPINRGGCEVTLDSDIRSTAKTAVLSWYAQQNIFPANSALPRIAHEVPKTGWTEFGQLDANNVWVEADRHNQPTHLHLRERSIRIALPNFWSTENQWAYDQTTKTIWFRGVEIAEDISRQPKKTVQFDPFTGCIINVFD